MKRLRDINTTWFFTELPGWAKLFLVFVRGDTFILIPLLICILLLAFISLKFMLIVLGCYISVRQFGEMIYWFLQQFHDHKYRPPDLGFKKLDNHSLYVFYQTLSIAGTVFGLTILVAAIMFMK
jgi:hypothetical protein